MSFVKLNKNSFATTTVDLHTPRTFVSSSTGITGALKVIVDRSHTQKDNIDDRVGLTGENTPQPFGENTFEGRRRIIMNFLADRELYENEPDYVPSDWFDTNTGELELAQLLDGSGIGVGPVPPEYEKYGFSAEADAFTETGYSDISMHPRNSTEMTIRAVKPTSSVLSTGSMALAMAERVLEPMYRSQNSAMGSKFTNFNCMNFFKPPGKEAAIVYPGEDTDSSGALPNLYRLTDDFSVEFWIKPRPNTDVGTVLHLPGFFSVNLLTGSEVNHKGEPVNYHLGLALGNTRANESGGVPYHFIFGSANTTAAKSKAVLDNHEWYHVAITYEHSSGNVCFYINGELSTTVKKNSVNYTATYEVLCLGAYYKAASSTKAFIQQQLAQGLGLAGSSTVTGHQSLSHASTFDSFLNADVHEVRLFNKVLNIGDVQKNMFTTYTGSKNDLRDAGLKFYVPCLYDVDYVSLATHQILPRLRQRQTLRVPQPAGFRVNYATGISPASAQATLHRGVKTFTGSINFEHLSFQSISGIFSTDVDVARRFSHTPYNTNHANIGGFANVNVHSFLKDYANLAFPFVHHVSESIGRSNGTGLSNHNRSHFPHESLNTVFKLTSSFGTLKGHQHRNCFILPCDNGYFKPNYGTLNHPTGSVFLEKGGFFINTKNIGDLSDVRDSRLFFIDDAYAANSTFESLSEGASVTQDADSRYNNGIQLFTVDRDEMTNNLPNLIIPSMDDPNIARSFDASDFVGPLTTIVDIPQLYYGNRIQPGSLRLKSALYDDPNQNSFIELRDNGHGVLYRHQTSGSAANWNKVGDVYYNEGLAYIRHPSLYAFADRDMIVEFKSDNNINVLETNVFCEASKVNSSSNPNYQQLRPSSAENEQANEFVYISTVYLHDDNLNVVAKAKMAQPVIKRSENKFLFRIKMDF